MGNGIAFSWEIGHILYYAWICTTEDTRPFAECRWPSKFHTFSHHLQSWNCVHAHTQHFDPIVILLNIQNPTLFLKVDIFNGFQMRTKGSLSCFSFCQQSHNTLGVGRTQKSRHAHHFAVLIRESLPARMNGSSILTAGANHSSSYDLIKIHLSMRDPLF